MAFRKISSHKALLPILAVAFIALITFAVYQVKILQKAHSTFADYYSFRGCVQLVKKTPTYGVCKTGSGRTIKMVLYHDKWYLDGDLPTGLLGHVL